MFRKLMSFLFPTKIVSRLEMEDILAAIKSPRKAEITAVTVARLNKCDPNYGAIKEATVAGYVSPDYQAIVRRVTGDQGFVAGARAWGVRKNAIVRYGDRTHVSFVKTKTLDTRYFKNCRPVQVEEPPQKQAVAVRNYALDSLRKVKIGRTTYVLR